MKASLDYPFIVNKEGRNNDNVCQMTMRDVHIWWAVVISNVLIGAFRHHLVLGLIIGIVIASHLTIATLWISESKSKRKEQT